MQLLAPRLFELGVDLAVRIHQLGQRLFVVVVDEDRLLVGPVRVLLEPLAIKSQRGSVPFLAEGLTIQMRVCRPFVGPVRSELMADVLPAPLGPRTMKLRCESG